MTKKVTILYQLILLVTLCWVLPQYQYASTFTFPNSFYYSLLDTIPHTHHNYHLDDDTIRHSGFDFPEGDSLNALSVQESTRRYRTNKAIRGRNARDLLDVPYSEKVVPFKFSSTYLSYEKQVVDTALWMNHLFYPQQDRYETYTFLGNLGSPSQYDHFFSRQQHSPFLFSRNHEPFIVMSLEETQYNVRKPFTIVTHCTAGSRRQAEQVLRVIHTQNVNPNFNFGIKYDFFGTKGVYSNQETRNNAIALFASYFKGNVSAKAAFVNHTFKNQENGGVSNDYFIEDTIVESRLVPFWLLKAQSIVRVKSMSGTFGYTLLNIKQQRKDSVGQMQDFFIPLITTRLIITRNRFSRTFEDDKPIIDYYGNIYINPLKTRDTVALFSTEAIAMLEIMQFAKIPGLPGLRGWLGYEMADYYYFKPEGFIYPRQNQGYNNSHFGVGAYSQSPFLSYQGAFRLYLSGYRAGDKIIQGKAKISPWKNDEMPQVKGDILISEVKPDIFLNEYFSNHVRWSNSFNKEKKFQIRGAIGFERWEAEAGYNLIHISDYLFFNYQSLPEQYPNVTITSVYAQKNIRFGGLNIFNRVVWQVNTNTQVLNLPQLITFSSLHYEQIIVPNALTGQIGFNIYYRSRFYADAYNPVIGQFYNQNEKVLGGYPTADLFANFKWKSVLIFLKYEHANQGFPDNQYFSALHYPINPRIFKIGVSWIFFD